MIYYIQKVLQSISRSKTYQRLPRSKFELQRSRYFDRFKLENLDSRFVKRTYFCNLSSCEVGGSSTNIKVFGKIFWFFSLAFILSRIYSVYCSAMEATENQFRRGSGCLLDTAKPRVTKYEQPIKWRLGTNFSIIGWMKERTTFKQTLCLWTFSSIKILEHGFW